MENKSATNLNTELTWHPSQEIWNASEFYYLQLVNRYLSDTTAKKNFADTVTTLVTWFSEQYTDLSSFPWREYDTLLNSPIPQDAHLEPVTTYKATLDIDIYTKVVACSKAYRTALQKKRNNVGSIMRILAYCYWKEVITPATANNNTGSTAFITMVGSINTLLGEAILRKEIQTLKDVENLLLNRKRGT